MSFTYVDARGHCVFWPSFCVSLSQGHSHCRAQRAFQAGGGPLHPPGIYVEVHANNKLALKGNYEAIQTN